MKKMFIMSVLLFFAAPCHGLERREQQVKQKSQRIEKALKLGTAAATAGIFYKSCSLTNRVLNEYARELPQYFSSFANQKTLSPLHTVMPCWSSRFASLLKKVHLPSSLVETLKPFAAYKVCRYPLATGAGLITAFSFYKIARATNFFGVKTMLYKITGLKNDKHWLKVDKAAISRDKDIQIRDKTNQITVLAGQVSYERFENTRLRSADLAGQLRRSQAEATDHRMIVTRLNGELRRLGEQIGAVQRQLSDLERQKNSITEQSRIKTLKIFDLFATITNLIKDDPSKYPDINTYQAKVLELLQDWCKDRKHDERIPEAFMPSLAIIETLPPEIKGEIMQQISKILINPALESKDTRLLQLMKKYGIELTNADTNILKACTNESHLLYPFVDGESCPVCLESHTPSSPTVRACGHILCKECYPKMADKPCPLCRKDSNGVAQSVQ